jgi:hypothetical protein
MNQSQPHRHAASRVSPRLLWAIVVTATVLTFVIGQVAKAAPPNVPSQATA